MPDRQWVLAGLVVFTGILSLALLSGVLATVFFAITVAYVLYPLRRIFVRGGLSRRVAAGLATFVALLATIALAVPLLWSLYDRRNALIRILRGLPDVLELDLFGFAIAVDVAAAVSTLRNVLAGLAVTVAGEAVTLGLKLFLFVLLVYALLLRPSAAERAVYRTVPRQYHDVITALHERIRDTLVAIYVLQGATAFATAVVAYVLFAGLGYDAALLLAVLAGILQFVPVVGPSVLIVTVAATDLFAGNETAAVIVTVLGLVFVGFLPDAVVRPQLASYTAGIPASLYFVGFTGGVLSVGLVGFIAGPLVVAVFVETVDLLAAERGPPAEQQKLS